jgi:hypothetical protein
MSYQLPIANFKAKAIMAYDFFLCPDDAISIPTATTNMNSMLANRMYVLLEERWYSPKSKTAQIVLTSGKAWIISSNRRREVFTSIYTLIYKIHHVYIPENVQIYIFK